MLDFLFDSLFFSYPSSLQVPEFSSLRQNLLHLSPRYKFRIRFPIFNTSAIGYKTLRNRTKLIFMHQLMMHLSFNLIRLANLPQKVKDELEDPHSR